MTSATDDQPTQGPKVLVAYGSKNGSTAGIAEMIAMTLNSEGLATDVLSADRVRSVGGYSAVVLGGSLYSGRWHRDARRFARRFGPILRDRPVWLFSSGPLDDSADVSDIPPVPQAARAATDLNARQHLTFGGRLTAEAKGFIAKAMVRNGRGGDFRNSDRIRAWSRTVAAEVRQ